MKSSAKSGKIKRLLLLLVGLGMIGGAIGFYMYNKPPVNFKKAKADYVFTADEMYASYTSDVEAGNVAYLSKVIELSGKLEEISRKDNGKISLIITAAGAPVGGINAELDDRFENADGLKVGQIVRIKGQCTGLQELDIFQDVVLKYCLVLD